MSEGCARPVRSFLRSAWKFSTHLPIRVAASFLMSSNMIIFLRLALPPYTSVAGDDRTDVFAAYHTRQVAHIVEIEHLQRHAIVAAHHDRGGLNEAEAHGEHHVVRARGIALRI